MNSRRKSSWRTKWRQSWKSKSTLYFASRCEKKREIDHDYNLNGIAISAASCSKSITNKEELHLVETEKSENMERVVCCLSETESGIFLLPTKRSWCEHEMSVVATYFSPYCLVLQCNYVAESASKLCYKENHKLTHLKTLKKFFVCRDCKQRSVTYGATPIPKHPCRWACNFYPSLLHLPRNSSLSEDRVLILSLYYF